MTTILTWNIQYGLGCDGRIDLARIAETALAMGPPDVICFQEIAVEWPFLDKGAGADQAAVLAGLLPGYRPVFRPALDLPRVDGTHPRFGNMVLSRLPIVQVQSHLLPRPPHGGVKHMRRQALEVVVEVPFGALRVISTHLEYYSPQHYTAQVDRLRDLHAEAVAGERNPSAADVPGSTYALPMPPTSCAICGDFNFPPDDPAYARMTAPFGDGTPRLVDAWVQRNPGRPHDPTCGIYDRVSWKQGPHCRDFVFLSEDLAPRLTEIAVNQETAASDHQPVRVTLAG